LIFFLFLSLLPLPPRSTLFPYTTLFRSVVSLESPHGTKDTDLSDLTSAFQKRMATSDLKGTGVDRIVKNADELDVVLIDLVDERRGFWLYPDGTTITNSLEIESCGAARAARRGGARLAEFGDEER